MESALDPGTRVLTVGANFWKRLPNSLHSFNHNKDKMTCIHWTAENKNRGAYHLTENFGNSGWKVNGKVTFRKFQPKLRSTFWGSPFIPVRTNQTECCLPLTNLSAPSRFQTRATQIRPFLDSNRNGCSNSAVNWYIAYHYAFDSPNGFFCQMVRTLIFS